MNVQITAELLAADLWQQENLNLLIKLGHLVYSFPRGLLNLLVLSLLTVFKPICNFTQLCNIFIEGYFFCWQKRHCCKPVRNLCPHCFSSYLIPRISCIYQHFPFTMHGWVAETIAHRGDRLRQARPLCKYGAADLCQPPNTHSSSSGRHLHTWHFPGTFIPLFLDRGERGVCFLTFTGFSPRPPSGALQVSLKW